MKKCLSLPDVDEHILTIPVRYNSKNALDVLVLDDTTKHDKLLYQDESAIDQSWFQAQRFFLMGLDDIRKNAITLYTTPVGDSLMTNLKNKYFDVVDNVRFLNELESNKAHPLVEKDTTTDIIEKQLLAFRELIKTVINDAPPLRKPIRLFRAIASTRDKIQAVGGHVLLSTTYAPFSGTIRQFSQGDCCVFEMLAGAGTKALWLQPISSRPNEFEILLHSDLCKISDNSTPIDKETRTYKTGQEEISSEMMDKLLSKTLTPDEMNSLLNRPTVRVCESIELATYEVTVGPLEGGRRRKTFRKKRAIRKRKQTKRTRR